MLLSDVRPPATAPLVQAGYNMMSDAGQCTFQMMIDGLSLLVPAMLRGTGLRHRNSDVLACRDAIEWGAAACSPTPRRFGSPDLPPPNAYAKGCAR